MGHWMNVFVGNSRSCLPSEPLVAVRVGNKKVGSSVDVQMLPYLPVRHFGSRAIELAGTCPDRGVRHHYLL